MRFFRKLVRGKEVDSTHPRPRFYNSGNLMPVLFAMLVFRHFGYQLFPQEMHGDIYGLAGAACLLVLIACTDVWWPLKVWAMGEELLTVGCTAAFLQWPHAFRSEFADERCSQALGFKLGSVGLVVVALLLREVILSSLAGSEKNEGSEK